MNAAAPVLLAEFADETRLVAAVHALRALGCARIEAYAPHPVDGLAAALALPPPRIAAGALVGGVAGALGGYGLQFWSAVVDYAVNVGGRPPHSWPMFVPIAVELALLGAALGAVAMFLHGSGLGRFHSPLADAGNFARASRDRCFLCLRADPSDAGTAHIRAALERAGALAISELAPP